MKTFRTTFLAASLAAGLGASAISSAQGLDPTIPVTLSYGHGYGSSSNLAMPLSFQTRRDTWNTVLVVSAIVLVVGLIQDDTTLAILGGAGVLVSLVQQDRRFQLQYSPRGFDLIQSGPVTFGLTPFSRPGLMDKPAPTRLGAYVTANFRF